MKLYASSTPDISKHNGYLKIGETNGDIDKRVEQECHELNVQKEIVWRDAVITERSHIDKMIHRYLVNQGFSIQQFDTTGQDTEWVKCEVADVEKAFVVVKQQLYNEDRRKKLSQKFYEELRNWYFWAIEESKNPDYTLRLIVRLLLCFFLKEKGLIPACLFDENYIKENLKENEYRYYKVIVRNLFFYSLNTPMHKREELENKNLIKNQSKIRELFQKNVPFLNGGLFTEHSGDELSLNDDYFFSAPRTRTIRELDGKFLVAGIVFILSQYKYTLDETDNSELIDPEFIGKIFESLLSCIDADTKESRRKVTGSYYTPREIVDYMVNESLDAYLQYNNDLLQCKILDPACGSGAFPCGIMNAVLQRLDPQKTMTHAERYQTKLKILQNVIYGVDIQPMAVQIAMLRLFLSLIQEVQPYPQEYNFGIESLPNLDYKFVAANTLKGMKIDGLFFHSYRILFEEVIDLKRDYFSETNEVKREHLRERIYRLERDLAEKSDNDSIKALCEWNHSETKTSPYFDSRWIFGVEKFDIVIGNPPYGQLPPADLLDYPSASGNNNTYVAFTERALQLTAEHGIVTLIMPSTWFSGAKFKNFRTDIIEKTDFLEIVQLPYDIFGNAYIDTAIISVRKTKPSGKTKFYKHEIRNLLHGGIMPKFEVFPTVEWKKFGKIFLNIPLLTIGKKFWFSKKNIKLGEIASINRGSLPPKANEISNRKTSKYNIRWFNGQVFRYAIKEGKNTEYVCYDDLRENKPIYFYQTKKILARQLMSRQFRMNLTYTEEVFAFRKNLYAIYDLSSTFDYFYILGILNSTLFSFMQCNFNASLQRDDFPSFSLDDFRNFPIPNISLAEQKTLIDLVRRRLKGADIDDKIDSAVYELYGVTPKEQSIINRTINRNI
jgi:type I restriction-modification system DNA methylase subunit